ncbi:MAG TPA: hypothetical protein VLH10_06650 [Yinghuangia sp.]|nr:hypothetical protein [Yinghuangia sp.]
MGEGAEPPGDFEAPAGARPGRAEPPLRVGTWTTFGGDEHEDVGGDSDAVEAGPKDVDEEASGDSEVEAIGDELSDALRDDEENDEEDVPEFAPQYDPDDVDLDDFLDDASGFGAAYVTGAAVPRARSADVLSDDDDGVADEDDGCPAGVFGDVEAVAQNADQPVFPPVGEPFESVGQSFWAQPQLLPGTSAFPSPYPGFEAYANVSPGAIAAMPVAAPETAQLPSESTESRRGRRAADDRETGDAGRLDPSDAPEPRRARGPFETAFLLGAPALVLVALVLYFGWARSAAIADYLGFDEEVLGFSAQEYLVRGIDTLDRPMLAVFAALLAVRMAHPRLVVRLRRRRRAAVRLSWVLRCAWFAVPAAAWAMAFGWPGGADRWPVLLPGALTVGVLVSAYGVLISRQLGAHRRETGMGVRPWSLSVVLTASTVVLSLFWTLGSYAEAEGRATARRMVEELPTRTAVVVHSARDLRIAAGQGVTVESPDGPDSAYKYRYAGLRLLRRDDGQLYLLPDRWSWNRPRLVVIREDAGVRVDYTRMR